MHALHRVHPPSRTHTHTHTLSLSVYALTGSCVGVEQLVLTKRDEKGLGKTLGMFTRRWEAGSYIWISVKGVPTPNPLYSRDALPGPG